MDYDSQRLVAAIAEMRVFVVLAVAQPDLIRLGQVEFLRAKAAAFVAAITHRLMSAQAAGAPPVVTSRKFDTDGLFLIDFGKCFHAVSFAGDERSVNKGRCGYGIASSTSRTSPGPRYTSPL